MWELAQVVVTDRDRIEAYLKEGYEPFAVTVDKYDLETIWFRKVKELELEVLDKPVRKQGRSRKTAETTKG